MRRLLAILGCFMLLVTAACSGSMHAMPEAGQSDINRALSDIRKSNGVDQLPLSDADAQALVERASTRLLAAVGPICDRAGYSSCYFNIQYEEDPQVNAWASGDGDIFITSGLVKALGNEEEVAAVIAHEMGHHISAHIDKGVVNTAAGAAVGAAVLGGLAAVLGGSGSDVADAVLIGASVGAVGGRLAYSKDHEREADYISAYMLDRAGYDLQRAGRVWVHLARQPGASASSGFFSTHPSGPERLAAWRITEQEVLNSPDGLPRLLRN